MAFSGRNPTKSERQWLESTTAMGCIVCLLEGLGHSPAMPHHIDGKTKPGAHLNTIPLCHLHHQGGNDCAEYTSRHPYKARFQERYGSEVWLLEQTKQLLGERKVG